MMTDSPVRSCTAPTMNAVSIAAAACSISNRTKSHSPAQRSFEVRFRNRYFEPVRTAMETSVISVMTVFGLGKGIVAWVPSRKAWQCAWTGHDSQSGSRGEQTVAPNSIKAWFSRPAPFRGKMSSANAHNRSCPSRDRGSPAYPISRL